jgi:anti-sigma B factor antagonist
MSVMFEKRNEVGLISLGSALTAASADSFREQFLSWWQGMPDMRNVVVDMGGADFLDSAGLGALIALLKRVSERGGDMKLARMQKKVRMVFEITRAYKVFDIFDTAEEALKACGGKPS